MLDVGEAVTLEPTVVDKVADGLHTYDIAPLADSPTEEPAQTSAPTVPVITGNGNTVTVTEAALVQPLGPLPVTT